MSKTIYTLKFAVTMRDSSEWTAQEREQWDEDQDKVYEALNYLMLATGNSFVAAHPDIFVCEMT